MNQTALGDIRILDLAGEMGVYCGKLLGDLGAEVIKIESMTRIDVQRLLVGPQGRFSFNTGHSERGKVCWPYILWK